MSPLRSALGVVVAAVLLILPSLNWADQVVATDRVTNHVKIHELPTSQSPVVGQLRPGESLQLSGEVPRWREIVRENGEPGFVSKSWTRVIEDAPQRDVNDLRIHFLNVGAGTCTVVECPGADAPPMVIDCGSLGGTSEDLDEDGAAEYVQGVLSQHSVQPVLVLSHADRDHYGWISTVLENVQVQAIWQGGNPDEYTADDFPEWKAAQVANGATAHAEFAANFHSEELPDSDSQLNCGNATALILTVNSGGSKNADSLVLEIRYDEFGVIFTGDAVGRTEENARVNFDGNVKTTVLSGSHHGARTHRSNSVTWAQATAPEVVVFSAGEKFGHPQCDAVERFLPLAAETISHATRCGEGPEYESPITTNKAIFMTEVSGTITVTSDGTSPLSLSCEGLEACSTTIAH